VAADRFLAGWLGRRFCELRVGAGSQFVWTSVRPKFTVGLGQFQELDGEFRPGLSRHRRVALQLLACSNQFALCFHSGAEPFPCTISTDGRSANRQCTVVNEVNYTLVNAILNYPVYLATVKACGADGSNCTATGSAPVCKFLNHGALIPGANVISTFDPGSVEEIVEAIDAGPGAATTCPKAVTPLV
jgi:hypothetical protein